MLERGRGPRAWLAAVPVPAAVPAAAASTPDAPAAAAASCDVRYEVTHGWGGGATVNVEVTNNASTGVKARTVGWSCPGGQTVTDRWNATRTRTGAAVTATNAAYDAVIAAGGGTVTFGLDLAYDGADPSPTAFTLNGTPCGGPTPTPTPTDTAATPAPTPTDSAPAGDLALHRPAWSYVVVWASRDWAGSGKDVQGLWRTAMATRGPSPSTSCPT
ncbi:cellulose binding domain-containing protein [Streptomyces sp. NPDC020983]|uniref:cellulose binding domain-containing protein n=1 Tax=Streptomyces sp. NPDC020983 TaxID=3365106 RepID=UPI0037BE1928